MEGYFKQRKGDRGTPLLETSTKSSKSLKSKRWQSPATKLADTPLLHCRTNESPIHSKNDEDESDEKILKQFDMKLEYGPCIGITRQMRWERAHRMGLDPPVVVSSILASSETSSNCLWHGRA